MAVRAGQLDDAGYAKAVGALFGAVTPENALKWDAVHPEPDRYHFARADRIVGFARAHHQRIRGHTLVWHNQLPGWLAAKHYTRDELIGVLHDHIRTVVGRYRGRIAEWDVVNEAVADGGGLRRDIWLDTIGPDYIAMAFRFAHEADPGAKLFYNDYGTEGDYAKTDAVLRLVRTLVDDGVPIDGVGLQTHVGTEPIPSFAATLRRFAGLGLDVVLTEVDVRIRADHGDAALRRQAGAYRRIVDGCQEVDRCRGIVFWGLDDADSWIPGAFSGFGDATLLDGDLRPKPAYAAVREALLRG